MDEMSVTCSYCGDEALLVDGSSIYPHRSDLKDKHFWACFVCEAWVGVHPGTDNPLGTLARADLRNRRHRCHVIFDQLQKKAGGSRREIYTWLAACMEIDMGICHFGMFDETLCELALQIMEEHLRG